MSSHTAGFSAAESSENSSKVNLLNLVRELGVKYGWTSKGKVRSPAILALLGEGACERSVAFKLSRPDYREPTKFDPVFARKSEFATTFLLDNLKRRLIGAGYKARLSTEVGDAVGTYDVLVLNETPCVVVKGTVPIVRIELKASMGLPMDQLSRYLLCPVLLFLRRLILGRAILLCPSELL